MDGGAAVTARGVCWSTTPNPVVTGNHTIDGTGSGIFTSNITGLIASTVYYVRAYATNSVGTAYGNEISFTTTVTITLPTVTTAALSAVTITSSLGGGNIVSDGGATVTARGVCWGAAANPGVTGNHTTDGNGTGTFTSAITGLTASTTYHVRAYATNSVGTAYGADSSFTTLPQSGPGDVYVAGFESVSGGGMVAKYWKNGVSVPLTNAVYLAQARSIYVTGTDVYVTGYAGPLGGTSCYLWKNGVALPTLTGFIDANSVFASGTDVYVAGTGISLGNRTAVLWKNGISTNITNGANNAYARAVFVSGNDEYVSGEESNGSKFVAKIWKNGVATPLTNGVADASAYSVYVSASDVYVAGTDANNAMLWKNGVSTNLGAGYAFSVYVSGGDVYVAGSSGGVATLWKNGVATQLTTNSSEALSVKIAGSDVYVSGWEKNTSGFDVGKLWKNGIATSMAASNVFSGANAVFVK